MPRLKYGIEIDGERCYEFEPRLLTLGGELAALEYIETLPDDVPEKRRNMLQSLAFTAAQITIPCIREVGVPPPVVTADDLLCLDVDDLTIVCEEIEAFRKKRAAAGESSQ